MSSRSPTFQTRAEFEEANEALMNQVDGETGGARSDPSEEAQTLGAAIDEIRDFLDRGARAGAYLYESRERRLCQSILDFWSSRCYSVGLSITADDAARTNRIVLEAHDPDLLPQLADDLCPYVGLDAFTGVVAARFFGREDDVNALLRRLPDQRLVIVTGASGSGKSSLVLAGLVPALQHGALPDSAGWLYVPELVPGSDPLLRLATALAGVAQPEEPAAWIAAQVVQLLANPGHAAQLLDSQQRTAVLVVDQFEEALTLPTEQTSAQYQAFVANLLAVAEDAVLPHRVVLTMRKNVEAQLARDYPELNVHYRAGEYPVHAMDSVRLREAIEKPAALVGLKFQSKVVGELVKSVVGEDAGLPLLQFSLMALWVRRTGNLITQDAFQRVGNPRQAMAESAERLYESLPRSQQLATVEVFVALARLGEDAAVYRNRMSRAMLYQVAEAQDVDAVLEKFSQARLLRVTVTDPHERRSDIAEVAHESLLRNWDMLGTVFLERRAERERRAFLRKQAEKWRDAKFDSAFLLEGLALEQAHSEIDEGASTELERDFMARSDDFARERENAKYEQERAKLQIERDLRNAAMVLAAEREEARRGIAKRMYIATGCALVAAVLASMALYESIATKHRADETTRRADETTRRADEATHRADEIAFAANKKLQRAEGEVSDAQEQASASRTYASLTRAAADRQLEDAKRKSAAIAARARQALDEAYGKVRQAQSDSQQQFEQRARSEAQTLAIRAHDYVDTDADLSVLTAAELVRRQPAATSSMAPLVLEAAKYSRPSARLAAEQLAPVSGIDALALDPAGERLAVGSAEGVAEWSTSGATNAPLRRFEWDQLRAVVNYLTYSPDGRHLAAATQRGVVLWDLDGRAAPRLLPGGKPCQRVHFSADSRFVASVQTGSISGINVWRVADGASLLSVDQQTNPSAKGTFDAFDAFFSRNSDRLTVLSVPESNASAVRKLEYPIKGDVIDRQPRLVTSTLCKERPFVYASGGVRFGVGLLPQLCLLDLLDTGDTESFAGFAGPRPEGLSDILFDDQSRFVVELFGQRREARVVDLETANVLRLQGAFDLPLSNSYEQFVSISSQGNRLAIKAHDGSVQMYELAMAGSARDLLGAVVWIDPDGKWALETTGSAAHPKYEMFDSAKHELLATLDPGTRRILAPSLFAVSADQRWLVNTGTCSSIGKFCVLAFDLRDGGQLHELRYDALLDMRGDLTLLQVGKAWELHLGANEVPVFQMAVPSTGNGGRSREPLADSVELGNARLFVVKTIAEGRASVSVYRVDGATSSLVRTIERDAPLGMNVSLQGDGRLLLLNDLRATEIFDLQASGDGPALVVPGRVQDVRFDAADGLFVTRGVNLNWEVHKIAQPESVLRVLPGNAVIDATAGYAWTALPGGKGFEVTDLVGRRPPLAIDGDNEGARVVFSRHGDAMLVSTSVNRRQRIYRLPDGALVFDAEQPTVMIVGFDQTGQYMLRSDGHFIPIDGALLVDLARKHVHRDLSDDDRCKILADWAACNSAPLPAAPQAIPTVRRAAQAPTVATAAASSSR